MNESELRGAIANLEEALAAALNDFGAQKERADECEARFRLYRAAVDRCFAIIAEAGASHSQSRPRP